MKKYLAPLGIATLLLAGCSSPTASESPTVEPASPESSAAADSTATETPLVTEPSPLPEETTVTPIETTEASEPATETSEPVETPVGIAGPPMDTEATETVAPSDAAFEEALTEALTQPDVVADPALDPETAFLATYQDQLQTLPDGPFEQLGTDHDAVNLGLQACADLDAMDYADALLSYAFTEGVTEAQVADYNAALNAAPGTLC